MPAEARREQILEAALVCFADRGYHAARMDDLVRASGLSKGSLYWHFRSKEEVFLALFDAFSADLYGAWDEAAASTANTLEVLRRECEIAVERFQGERRFLLAWAEFLTHPVARERMGDSYATARHQIGAIFAKGQARGEITTDWSPSSLAVSLVAALEGLFLQWLVDPDFELESQVEKTWQLLAKGLRP